MQQPNNLRRSCCPNPSHLQHQHPLTVLVFASPCHPPLHRPHQRHGHGHQLHSVRGGKQGCVQCVTSFGITEPLSLRTRCGVAHDIAHGGKDTLRETIPRPGFGGHRNHEGRGTCWRYIQSSPGHRHRKRLVFGPFTHIRMVRCKKLEF